MFRSQALGHGSAGRGKLAACTLRALPGTPAVTPGRGEGGRAELRGPGSACAQGTDQGQQKHPGGVTSGSSLCSPAAGKGRFPVGSAQAAPVPAGGGGTGCLQGGLSCRSFRDLM